MDLLLNFLWLFFICCIVIAIALVCGIVFLVAWAFLSIDFFDFFEKRKRLNGE